jgi:hypothetical protein
MPMSGITSVWLLYEMATASQAGRRRSCNMAFSPARIGLIGSLVMLASESTILEVYRA